MSKSITLAANSCSSNHLFPTRLNVELTFYNSFGHSQPRLSPNQAILWPTIWGSNLTSKRYCVSMDMRRLNGVKGETGPLQVTGAGWHQKNCKLKIDVKHPNRRLSHFTHFVQMNNTATLKIIQLEYTGILKVLSRKNESKCKTNARLKYTHIIFRIILQQLKTIELD